MEDLIARFKQEVKLAASNPNFVDSEWYVQYHLEIVEKISLELCAVYQDADANLVLLLVWLHDYGKIIANDDGMTGTAAVPKLLELGFDAELANKAVEYARMIDKRTGIEKMPLEAQIVSSADAASHLVGPFPFFWWHQHSEKSVGQLMADNREKLQRDWEKKIVLPEVKAAFLARYRLRLEETGSIPESFLSHT